MNNSFVKKQSKLKQIIQKQEHDIQMNNNNTKQFQLNQKQKQLQQLQQLYIDNKNNNNYEQDNQQIRGKSNINKINNSLSCNEIKKLQIFIKKYLPMYFTPDQLKQLNYRYKKTVHILKYKQAIYYGQTIKNSQNKLLKQGKGIMIYNFFKQNQQNIRIFEGLWSNDKKSGQGFQKFLNQSVYHGQYKCGKPQGRGKFTNHEGQIYQGQWKDGLKQGQGYFKGINGQTYIGQWKIGLPQGYGVYINQIGDKYQGQFKNSVKHGQGIQKFINGDIYKGKYQNGKPNGYGQYYWKNKSYFKGNFKNGLRQGYGLWKKSPGKADQYQGNYQNDKKWGYGVFKWINGNIYKGNYLADQRNGYGQIYWINGDYYKGNWMNGLQNGQGQIFIKNQGLRKGIFEKNQLVQITYENLICNNQLYQCQTHIDNVNNQQELQTKKLQNNLLKNLSSSTKMSVKSKKSRFSTLKDLKFQRPLQKTDVENSRLSFIGLEKNRKSTKNKQMKAVHLQKLFNEFQNSKSYYPPANNMKNNNISFRINKRTTPQNIYQNSAKFESEQKNNYQNMKKNRILHSSFYIHRFKNIGLPKSSPKILTKSEQQKSFN